EHFNGGGDDGINYARRVFRRGRGKGFGLGEEIPDHAGLLGDFGSLLAVGAGDGQQHALETGASPLVVRRKVGAAVKGLTLGGEKGGEGPATLSADGGNRGLVAAIHVGALVAIHLDGNEVLIDDGGDFGIVIGFAVHDVTPVAPDGADIEQDGLVLFLRQGEGFRSPLMPANGLVHGGAEIGGRGARERVGGVGGHSH